jgi:hypothetical protein
MPLMHFLERGILCHHFQAPIRPGAGSFRKSQRHKDRHRPDIPGTLWTVPDRDGPYTNHHENSHCDTQRYIDIHQNALIYPYSFFHRHCYAAYINPTYRLNVDPCLSSSACIGCSKHAFSSDQSACPAYALSKSAGASCSLPLKPLTH